GARPLRLLQQSRGRRYCFAMGLLGLASQTAQNGNHGRVVVSLQSREQIVTDAVAREADVAIGTVRAKRLLQCREKSQQLGSGRLQQLPHDLDSFLKRPTRGDAAQSLDAGATPETVQHRLGLVAGAVARAD